LRNIWGHIYIYIYIYVHKEFLMRGIYSKLK